MRFCLRHVLSNPYSAGFSSKQMPQAKSSFSIGSCFDCPGVAVKLDGTDVAADAEVDEGDDSTAFGSTCLYQHSRPRLQ